MFETLKTKWYLQVGKSKDLRELQGSLTDKKGNFVDTLGNKTTLADFENIHTVEQVMTSDWTIFADQEDSYIEEAQAAANHRDDIMNK